MKKRTRLITLTLAILTVTSCFAACGNKSDETTEKAISNSNLDEYGRDYIADSVPQDLRFDGETVTFFTRNDTEYWKIEMDAESTTNDTLNDAVFYRNATVENIEYEGDFALVLAVVDDSVKGKMQKYIVKG